MWWPFSEETDYCIANIANIAKIENARAGSADRLMSKILCSSILAILAMLAMNDLCP
jgi:hypothetical protein